MNEKQILSDTIKTYGAAAQTIMMFEEMSELQKELCKHARGNWNVESIAEEIADVEIMLEQMKLIHCCEFRTREYREKKLLRLAERIYKNGGKEE